jgi:uncharacterized metal-binding protein YceD (DUF177 family)
MDYLSKYDIEFAKLDPGRYSFDFQVSDEFFAEFAGSEIKNAGVSIKVDMDRQENLLVLGIDFTGIIRLTCDRCLEKFGFPVSLHKDLVVKIREAVDDSGEEDVVIVRETDQRFALASHIYDYLSLLVPYRKLHPDREGSSGCDPGALRAIEALNGQGPRGEDGRWDALKNIKLNDE